MPVAASRTLHGSPLARMADRSVELVTSLAEGTPLCTVPQDGGVPYMKDCGSVTVPPGASSVTSTTPPLPPVWREMNRTSVEEITTMLPPRAMLTSLVPSRLVPTMLTCAPPDSGLKEGVMEAIVGTP